MEQIIYKIYIHGRPQGQDIWPQCENVNDSHYLNSFLDSGNGSKVDAVLQTDVWQDNTYYTYLRRKNVVEKIARGGIGSSYFAITIRFDKSFCRNVSSLYNLLGLVYEKFCKNNFVKTTNGTIQYLVNRFDERNDLLTQTHSIVSENIEKIIAPYIDTIKSSKDTIGSNPIEYSLQDVDSPSFVENMLQHKLVISADYVSLSSQVQPLKTKNTDLSTELDKWKKNATSLQLDKNDLQTQISDLKSEKEKLEKSLFSASENIAKSYTSQLRAKEEELNKLKSSATQREQKLQEVQVENERLKKENKDAIKNKEISDTLELIKEPFIKIARLLASRFPENPENIYTESPQNTGKNISMDKIKTWIPLGTFVLVFFAVGLSVYSRFFYSPNSRNFSNLADSIKTRNEIITTLNKELDSLRNLTILYSEQSSIPQNKITIENLKNLLRLQDQTIDIVTTNNTLVIRFGTWNNNRFSEIPLPEEVDLYVNNQKLLKTERGRFEYTPDSVGTLKIECKFGNSTLSAPKAREYSVSN